MAIDEKENDPKTSLGRLTRRSFLSHAGAATAAAAIAPLAASPALAVPPTGEIGRALSIPGTVSVTLR